MAGKTQSARDALNRVPSLHHDFHGRILAELAKEGLVDNATDGGAVNAGATCTAAPAVHAGRETSLRRGRLSPLRTPMQAAADCSANGETVRALKAQAARLGYVMPTDQILDPVAIDKAFAGKDVAARLAWKMTAAKLALIP